MKQEEINRITNDFRDALTRAALDGGDLPSVIEALPKPEHHGAVRPGVAYYQAYCRQRVCLLIQENTAGHFQRFAEMLLFCLGLVEGATLNQPASARRRTYIEGLQDDMKKIRAGELSMASLDRRFTNILHDLIETICEQVCGRLTRNRPLFAEYNATQQEFVPLPRNNFSSLPYRREPQMTVQSAPSSHPPQDSGQPDSIQSSGDDDLSVEALKRKAASGDADAAYRLGVMYYWGMTGEPDCPRRNYDMAHRYLTIAADAAREGPNTYDAENLIGHMYYDGTAPNGEQSYQKAFNCISEAADHGVLSARSHIGYMLSIGSGCTFDFETTRAYYQQFLGQADVGTRLNYAVMLCHYGYFQEAIGYLIEAVNANPAQPHAEAAFWLGTIYRLGAHRTPFAPDYQLAVASFEKCKDDQRFGGRACFMLGMCYFNPTGQFQGNFFTAYTYFRKSAEMGYPRAYYLMGFMNEYGHVGRNLLEAISCYELSAQSGEVLSAVQLAYLYQEIDPPDYGKAFDWARWSASRGIASGYFAYANLLYLGRGCDQDLAKALQNYEKAREYGVTEAQVMIDRVHQLLGTAIETAARDADRS